MELLTALGNNPLAGNLSRPNETPQFFGETFNLAHDQERLTALQDRVEELMADGKWRTLPMLVAELKKKYPRAKFSEASISARLRDMRRRGWNVERERVIAGSGSHQYRAMRKPASAQMGLTGEEDMARWAQEVDVAVATQGGAL